MKILNILQWGERKLRDLETPKLETEVILAHILHCDRAFLKSHREQKLSLRQYLLNKKCVQQRKNKIPLAYILKSKKWGGMDLFVNKKVLIPRDETEILCHHIVHSVRDFIPQSVLDMGTGSGCIAIFLAQAFPQAEVLAVDSSSQALQVAKKNIKKNKVSVSLFKSDLWDKIPEKKYFDIIVANLPYVPEDMQVSPEVKKEPSGALFAGKDGLECIRKFAEQIRQKNIQFRELWLEFLPSQKTEIETIFSDFQVEFFTDCGGDVFFARITLSSQ